MTYLRSSLAVVTTAALVGWLAASPQDWTDPAEPEQEPAGQSVSEDGELAGLESMTFVRGVEVPVAAVRGSEGERTRTALVDTYLDWDYGTAVYLGEDGAMAVTPMAKNWDMRHVQLPDGGGMVALCFQPGTGLTYLLDGNGEWAPIEEPTEELVIGDYDVTLTIDVDRVFALRFDRFSGRSWTLEDDGWAAIPGNLRGWPVAEDQ